MSDIIYYKNGEETFRIYPPTDGTKCPETKLEVKKMTSNKEIEKVKGEIKVLEKKLALLEEIERHNAKPKMHLENGGEFSIVSYDDEIYYRLEYPNAIIWYKRKDRFAKDRFANDMMLVLILDLETHRLLEDKWNNEVITQKDEEPYCPDEPFMINCVLEGNPPNGYSYWNEWYKELGSKGILHNLKISSIDKKTPEPQCPDEPEYYDEIEWNIKEGTAPPEPTPNKFLQRLLDGKIDERGYVDLREPTSSVFRQKLFDGIKSVFYDPDYERTHWKHKVNMAVDEVLTHFYDVLPNKYEVIPNKKEIVSDFEKGWNCCVVNIEMCMEYTDD